MPVIRVALRCQSDGFLLYNRADTLSELEAHCQKMADLLQQPLTLYTVDTEKAEPNETYLCTFNPVTK